MKKVIVLVVTVCLFSVSRSQAQGFHLGIKGGTNLSQISGRSFDQGFQWNFVAGAFAELDVSSKFGIQPELLFSQTTSRTASNFRDIYDQGINSQNVKLNYMSIPILLSFKPISLLSLQLGPQFGILMNSSQTVTRNGANAFKSGDFSMVVGAQLNLGPFKGGARYVYGFSDINNVTNFEAWNNRSIQLYVGLRLF